MDLFKPAGLTSFTPERGANLTPFEKYIETEYTKTESERRMNLAESDK
jgi:hypothetical protein